MKLSVLNKSLEAEIKNLQSKRESANIEELQTAINCSKAINDLSARVIDSHKTDLEKCRFMAEMVEVGLLDKKQFNQIAIEHSK